MHIAVPHRTSRTAALGRVKQALNQSRAQLMHQVKDIEERWEGDTLHFGGTVQGKRITGTLSVTEDELVIDAKLPLLWRMFEGKIERAIKEQIESMPR